MPPGIVRQIDVDAHLELARLRVQGEMNRVMRQVRRPGRRGGQRQDQQQGAKVFHCSAGNRATISETASPLRTESGSQVPGA